jgi:hypothetical protein
MKTYTIQQFKEYLKKSDSLGDALYFCDEEHIDKANEPDPKSEEEDEEGDFNEDDDD